MWKEDFIKIMKKWAKDGSKAKFSVKKGRKICVYFPEFKDISGCFIGNQNKSNNEKAIKDLLEKLWENFSFLCEWEESLMEPEKNRLKCFRDILGIEGGDVRCQI